jgi:hypothetical protein
MPPDTAAVVAAYTQHSLPDGVKVPPFLCQPPPDVASGSDSVRHAILDELCSCGWVAPDRVDSSVIERLRVWNLPCDVVVGLRDFFEEIIVWKPWLQREPQKWSGMVVMRVRSASNVRRRTAGDQTHALLPSQPALVSASLHHNLPRGVSIPPFACMPQPAVAPGQQLGVLHSMLAELTACGWTVKTAPDRLDNRAINRLRGWNLPVDAIVGLRSFMEAVLISEPRLQRTSKKWSGVVIGCASCTSKARIVAEQAAMIARAADARPEKGGGAAGLKRSRDATPAALYE